MQTYFNELADRVTAALQGDEVALLSFAGEDSDFVRFNKSEVRQAGSVQQRELDLDLVSGQRHCGMKLTLAGDLEQDEPRVRRVLSELRERLAFLPEDPHLLYATEAQGSEQVRRGELPQGGAAIERVRAAGQGRDLVGIYAAGAIHRGFANSLGQRNWHTNESYNLDWSFYHQADKAVKTSYAGFAWDQPAFERKVAVAAEQLAALSRPARTVEKGHYRVYLAPAALNDVIDHHCWDGFGLKAHRTKQTPFLRMIEDGATLNPAVTLSENTAEGVAPNFQEQGFLRPDHVTLIEGGAWHDCLVSPRSAREYGVATNGASAMEWPESLDLAAGELASEDALSLLGTGVYVSNVWYLNWSDRPSCRTTGMTRFATFWVEKGQIQAPLNVMRFDETAYRMLGSNLVGLTRERDLILSAGSYFRRSTGSGRMPGALVDDFHFTL
ncbi:MAG: TldD/PmbA family protein [Planctomycetota bacterium]